MNIIRVDHLQRLAIGVHRDDVELGCGGTLAKLSKVGAPDRALIFPRGRPARSATPIALLRLSAPFLVMLWVLIAMKMAVIAARYQRRW